MFYSGYVLRRSSSQVGAPEYKLEALPVPSLVDSVSFILSLLKE
jgi:hypothetical protein